MISSRALFLSIATRFEKEFNDINQGYLLSSPSIEYRGKAFALLKNDALIIRLAQGQTPENFGVRAYRPYRPFKSTMQTWFEIPSYYQSDWELLGKAALNKIMSI